MEANRTFKTYFERKKKSSAGFSLRGLARKLGVSASFLSQLINGKKPIPAKLVKPLAKALDIEPEMLSMPKRRVQVRSEVEDWSLAGVDAHKILRNWYYIPILELTTLADFDGSAQSIAERLGLSQTSTAVALRELIGLGLVEIRDGKYAKTDSKLRFTSATTTHLIRKFHDDMLEKGQHALRTAVSDDDFQRRLITGITVSAAPEAIAVAKQKLAAVLHEIANELSAAPGTEVYQLCGLLFPLTQR